MVVIFWAIRLTWLGWMMDKCYVSRDDSSKYLGKIDIGVVI
jgi:hypothetical protein